MRVMVTGATGFVGRHVVAQLIAQGHSVVATARNLNRAREMPWFDQVDFVQCNLHENFQHLLQSEGLPDAIVHLAWPGLPNYRDFFHVSTNLPNDLAFLEAAVKAGVQHILVAGTCLEYGIQYGPLTETMETKPITPYGFAKDVLRKSLELLRVEMPFTFQWMRLFYMHGEGQNKNSLLAHLDQVIDEGGKTFNMSPGDQLRDYLPIQDVALYFVNALEIPECQGVINCCSGVPISVFDLVQEHCKKRGSSILVNRGFYPYSVYEPLAFWGISQKLKILKKVNISNSN
jgi:nucleoside-diphosphate-sugar epimerase